jgi:hypothetical protein
MVSAQFEQGQAGSYVDGEWVASFAAATTVRIITPQPLTANDLQLLEDGEHVRDFIVTWARFKLMTREGDRDADRIVYDGDRYKAMQTDDRKVLGKFYRTVLRRLEPGTL